MKTEEIKALADLVIYTAQMDTTAPDPQNPRSGWITDLLLTQMINRFVVDKNNDPAALREIGWQAADALGKLPEMECLALLAVLRAEILLPLTEERKQTILNFIGNIATSIMFFETTAESKMETRVKRLKSLWDYYRGVFYDNCGMFGLAAEMQMRSAKEAKHCGDVSGETIAFFMRNLYILKGALCEKNSAEAKFFFDKLEKRFNDLALETRGSALEVLWGQVNGPVFMLEACVWLDREHPKWDEWVKTSLAGMEKLGSGWELCADFVRAVDMEKRVVTPLAAERALNRAADSSDANERRATVLLILARHALSRGDAEEAKQIVSSMPEHGAQHVVAVAKRLLGE